MPSNPAQVITYDSFNGGEYSEYNQSAPANSFHGTNVMVYANGMIGPRPGLRNITPNSMPSGDMSALETTRVPGRSCIFVVGDTIYYSDLLDPSSTASSIGTLDATPTAPLASIVNAGTIVYLSSDGDKSYIVSVTVPSIAALTGSPGGTSMEIYGERLVVTGDSANRRRVYYSDAADYNSWPPTNFFNVGDDTQVTNITQQRQHLTITKEFGIFVLTGVPGVNAVLRQLSRTEGPIWDWHVAVDEDDLMWFLPVFRDNPVTFNGTQPEQIGYFKEIRAALDAAPFSSFPLRTGIVPLKGDLTPGSVVITQGNALDTMFINHNGVWTRHHAEVDISGLLSKVDSIVVVADGNDPAKLYVMQLGLNRPAFADDIAARPGDDSLTPINASFNLPEWWSQNGQDVRVRTVVIDFVKWDTGSDATNHFDVRTEALGAEDNDGRHTSDTYSFDEDQSLSSSSFAGTAGRIIHRFGEDAYLSPGFQLFIENIRGVFIKRIDVTVEANEELFRR